MTYATTRIELDRMFDAFIAQNPKLSLCETETQFLALAVGRGFNECQVGSFLGLGE